MLPQHVILHQFESASGQISQPYPTIDVQLKSSGSPKTFLQDVLFGENGLPEGAVPHLLSCKPAERDDLKGLLKEFCSVFASELPKQLPPNRGLGDVHEIPTAPDTVPIRQRMYRHSPQE